MFDFFFFFPLRKNSVLLGGKKHLLATMSSVEFSKPHLIAKSEWIQQMSNKHQAQVFGLQGDPTSPFWRRSALGFFWKEWC